MNREDFPMIGKTIYFDNGATTLKSKHVIDSMNRYYTEYTSNIHRGDYEFSLMTNELYDGTRHIVKSFINGKNSKVIFTIGTTESINMIVFGFMKKKLKKGDIVLLNKAEHASNILPWFKLKEEIGIEIDYIPLNKNFEIDIDNIDTNKVKVISIAQVSNVIGDVRDIKKISDICKKNNIYLCVDGAQSVPHMKVDFDGMGMDFLSFSAHKMTGPTGVGCLVVKEELFKEMEPLYLGGGMNLDFYNDGSYELHTDESKFEAGTPPIAEVIGLREACLYLEKIGMDKIHEYEVELKKYLVSKLEKNKRIIFYNKNSNSGILSFNVDGVFAQDVAIYLSKHNICVRAGNHCAKLLDEEIGISNTVRVSLYFYNTKEEIDKLVKVLDNDNILREII
ncbi:MAG: cysteine desulfurase [Bacilli bacterium]|nr:cysteine desulfurase [Bacilli bacterium]